MRNSLISLLVLASVALLSACDADSSPHSESVCFGKVANGRLKNGIKLPTAGNNFTAYSSLGANLGRTYVHSKVVAIVLTAYTAMEQSAPGKVFVYGETGWAAGGRVRPHRTHQNGLSVDFMVPIVDAAGRSVPLPTSIRNKFGYNIDFDENGKFEEYTIDFEAMAEHLYQLDVAAKAHGSGLALVIFDPPYFPKLFATKRGEYLKANINFMKGGAWVRHDEHYHVDFSVLCLPINQQ
jgi:penicillin-insensitive murein DD-endopeptidase